MPGNVSTASTSLNKGKRKALASQTDSESKSKKQKPTATIPSSTTNSSELAPNGQPTNKVLPTSISFPKKTSGSLRIASWNVSGLAAAQKKGFKYYVEAEDADILVLTETKVNNVPVDPLLDSKYPYKFWSIADKKGYSGTVILSKKKPISSSMTLPGHPDPKSVKGRIVTLEFENVYVVGTYVVNAGQDLKTLKEKEEWNRHFDSYIRKLDGVKPVIWAGDLNVAPTAKDLTNAKKNWNKTPGYTESETKAFARILDVEAFEALEAPNGTNTTNEKNATKTSNSSNSTASTPKRNKFIDVWRDFHPDEQHYTYFSYRFNCRAKGIGWRLDMYVLSERLVKDVKLCEIRGEVYGASDHCPVVLEIAESAFV